MIGGTTELVGLLRDPKVGSLSPRMQNAAFAALALDFAYVPLGVAPERLEAAVHGLVALGFAGANVTTPHKRAVVALCDEVEGDVVSVNTLVIRDGRVLGSSTDTAALGGRRPASAAVIGAGGAATAWIAVQTSANGFPNASRRCAVTRTSRFGSPTRRFTGTSTVASRPRTWRSASIAVFPDRARL